VYIVVVIATAKKDIFCRHSRVEEREREKERSTLVIDNEEREREKERKSIVLT
jgi:hypothetical protein